MNVSITNARTGDRKMSFGNCVIEALRTASSRGMIKQIFVDGDMSKELAKTASNEDAHSQSRQGV